MITSIRLQNFKGHRDTTVPLGRFTVLVGTNGVGKSTLLQALAVVSELAAGAASSVFSGDQALDYLLGRDGEKKMSLCLGGTSEQGPWRLKTDISTGPTSGEVLLGFEWKHGDEAVDLSNTLGDKSLRSSQLVRAMGAATLYKLRAEKIAAAAYSDSVDPVVEYDGTNTAVALAALKLGQDEAFASIEKNLRVVIPNVKRVRIRRATVRYSEQARDPQERVGSKIYLDFEGVPGVPAHMVSDGTLITLAILTILYTPNHPRVLLLDDFDHSLHPQAQIEMVRLLKRLLKEFPDVQIVATTHSPYILDELSPEDVVVFALRADGTVATKRLSDHPQAAKMKDALSAGQLWSLDPEADWVPDEATAAQ